MAFKFKTSEERSKLMSKIRSNNTTPEKLLRKELWKVGIRYRKNYKNVAGNPDIAIVGSKIAVFVDGEFWHGYEWEQKEKKIKANRKYWIPKIERNMKRDSDNNKVLKKMGWKPIRFWQKQVVKDTEKCVRKIQRAIEKSNSK